MRHNTILAAVLACAALSALSTATAQVQNVRLIAITGNNPNGIDPSIHQLSLYEVDVADGSSVFLHDFEQGFDSQAIGFNFEEGMLYRTSGIDSWKCSDPNHYAFNDTQYMEKLDPDDLAPSTQVDTIAIFNADPLGRPKPAPRPTWVYPTEVRVDPSDPCNDPDGEDTNDEYNAIRGLAYSSSRDLFFATDKDDGIFTMTPDGISTYLGAGPRDGDFPSKGIAFVDVNGEERLYVGGVEPTTNIDGDPLNPSAELVQIDPATGDEISSVVLRDWQDPTKGVAGVVALSVNPETGVLYGIGKGLGTGASPPDQRELLIIDPLTGLTTLVGDEGNSGMGINVASMAFVWDALNPTVPGDTDGDQDVDLDDLNNVRNNFGSAQPPIGDTDGDNDVDLDDLNAVRNNFGAVAGSAVPEPSTMVLALAGLAVVGYRFRRK